MNRSAFYIIAALVIGVLIGWYSFSPEKTEISVKELISQADANVANFAKVIAEYSANPPATAEDTLKFNNAAVYRIYWIGVGEALKSIESPETVVLKQ